MSKIIDRVLQYGIPPKWMQNTAFIQVYAGVKDTGLQVELNWKRSRIKKAGNGCFAVHSIEKGDIIRQGFLGQNVIACHSKEELPFLTESTYNYLEHFGYTIDEHDETVYLWIPPNGINHSLSPNVQSSMVCYGIETVALRDIEEGEELTANYLRYRNNPPTWYREVMQDRPTLYDFLATIPNGTGSPVMS